MALNPITLEPSAPGERALADRLNQALVRELLIRTKASGPALIGAAVLMWLLMRPWAGAVVTVLIGLLCGLTVLRIVSAFWFERGHVPHMRAFLVFTLTNCLIGIVLGAVILEANAALPPLRLAMFTVVVVAVDFGAMVSLAGSQLSYLAYLGPNAAATIYAAFAFPLADVAHLYQAMALVFALSMLVMGRAVHRSVRRQLELQLRLEGSLEELQETQARLVDASRQAGRADVATAVIHNVGNVLNSVNVSAAVVVSAIAGWKTAGLAKVVALLGEHDDDLAAFLRDDPRGQKIVPYLVQIIDAIERDKRAVTGELQSLSRNIEHIRNVVRSQQVQVTSAAVAETFPVETLLEDAIKFSAGTHHSSEIEVVRRFEALPPAVLDRHKALQILLNLFANARDAVTANPLGERRIIVHAERAGAGELAIAIEDNGCGIAHEHLDRIFTLGFTTKPHGHGLGLHYSACAARELGGNLTASSAGPGRGAQFRLTLPLGSERAARATGAALRGR